MKPVLERIRRTIQRFHMFSSGMTVGVAVSGGADSVCLLHVLREFDIRLHVLHLNHKLRGDESRADAEFVRNLAESLSLPYGIRDVAVSGLRGNLEQNARQARLDFFRESIASGLVERVATGHTRDDQAETVLFRFLRGSGTAGLAGIRPVTSDGLVRPLLEISRQEIEQYLRRNGIGWREDSSNAGMHFARNRIRHELLPALEREWNPALRPTLAHTAEWARDEEAWWTAEIDRIAPRVLEERADAVYTRAANLLAQPPAIARRLVRRAMERARGDLRRIEFTHVQAVLDLASAPAGHGRVQAAGLEVLRSFDWLRFATARPVAYPFHVPASVPGAVSLPGLRISLELIENSVTTDRADYVYNGVMDGLDWPRLSGPLVFRNWRPGDRYQPAATNTGEAKLKLLFQQARIPVWERRQWPVLLDRESIVWVRRFGAAAGYAANSGSKAILRIREL